MARTTAEDVARFILRFHHEHGDYLSNLKLQKLVYYAQAWFLALNDGEPLFDDRIEAWVHGPVVPSVYHEYKEFSWKPIVRDPGEVEFSAEVEEHLEEIIDVFGGYSAYQLERMTHDEDPWRDTRGNLPIDAPCSREISHASMERYYRKLAEQE